MAKPRAFLHFVAGKPHQHAALHALHIGLRRHGVESVLSDNFHDVIHADFVVTWGDKYAKESRRPRLCLEAGYINGSGGGYVSDRLRFISAGWNGLHGFSDALPEPAQPDRWQALGIDLLPWKCEPGTTYATWRDTMAPGYVLLLGQHPGDAAAPAADEWLRIQGAIEARALRYHYRPHPTISETRPLQTDLAGARLAVTWSSTAAVEAVIAGVPTVTYGRGAIAWPVTTHSFNDDPFCGDRSQWAYNLAYRQWSLAELANGEAWQHLQNGIEVAA